MIEVKDKTLEGYTFIDLFAGLGGFHLALASYGAKCVFASEWDKDACDTYESNFGFRPAGDITKIDEKEVPDHDILCAGFCCQPFSICGRKLGFDDTRGTLFFDVARIIKEKQPKVVFLENVRNLLAHDKGNTFKVIKQTLEDLGYSVHFKVLNGSNFGVPQERYRIYIVCFKNGLNDLLFNFPEPFELTTHVKDYLLPKEEIPEKWYTHREVTWTRDNLEECGDKPIRVGLLPPDHQGQRIYSINGCAITFSANGGGSFSKSGGYAVDGRARKLMPREMARLCGYPDSYILCKSDGQARKQFGNTVIIDVLQYIVAEISKILNQ